MEQVDIFMGGGSRENQSGGFRLDIQFLGVNNYYILLRYPHKDSGGNVAMVVDLNDMSITQEEIERFDIPDEDLISVAFVGIHAYRIEEMQNEIKDRFPELYRKCGFFTDISEAFQWVKGKCSSC